MVLKYFSRIKFLGAFGCGPMKIDKQTRSEFIL